MWWLVVFFVHPWSDLTPVNVLKQSESWAECSYHQQVAVRATITTPDIFVNCVWVPEQDQEDQ